MTIKNPKQLLVNVAEVPASIESGLPDGVPKLSTAMKTAAASMPTMPDFPMAIPDVPTLPAFSFPGLSNGNSSGNGNGNGTTVEPTKAKKSLVKFVYE